VLQYCIAVIQLYTIQGEMKKVRKIKNGDENCEKI